MGLNWVNKNKNSQLGSFIERHNSTNNEQKEDETIDIKIKENTGIVEKSSKKARIITEENKELLRD